jgi:hypothetical protein
MGSVYNASTHIRSAWSYGAGITTGTLAIAFVNNSTAFIAVRDKFNSY